MTVAVPAAAAPWLRTLEESRVLLTGRPDLVLQRAQACGTIGSACRSSAEELSAVAGALERPDAFWTGATARTVHSRVTSVAAVSSAQVSDVEVAGRTLTDVAEALTASGRDINTIIRDFVAAVQWVARRRDAWLQEVTSSQLAPNAATAAIQQASAWTQQQIDQLGQRAVDAAGGLIQQLTARLAAATATFEQLRGTAPPIELATDASISLSASSLLTNGSVPDDSADELEDEGLTLSDQELADLQLSRPDDFPDTPGIGVLRGVSGPWPDSETQAPGDPIEVSATLWSDRAGIEFGEPDGNIQGWLGVGGELSLANAQFKPPTLTDEIPINEYKVGGPTATASAGGWLEATTDPTQQLGNLSISASGQALFSANASIIHPETTENNLQGDFLRLPDDKVGYSLYTEARVQANLPLGNDVSIQPYAGWQYDEPFPADLTSDRNTFAGVQVATNVGEESRLVFGYERFNDLRIPQFEIDENRYSVTFEKPNFAAGVVYKDLEHPWPDKVEAQVQWRW